LQGDGGGGVGLTVVVFGATVVGGVGLTVVVFGATVVGGVVVLDRAVVGGVAIGMMAGAVSIGYGVT